MKKRYIIFMAVACGLGLLACSDEELAGSGWTEPEDVPAIGSGRCVVDYTLGGVGAYSRAEGEADGETQQPLSPVRSLTYLLYEGSGTDASDRIYTLVKRREIRDISEKTQWPMTRENMTWNQREDLKDTLDRASVYKVVFVANADAKLHNNEQVLFNASLDVETPEGEEPQELLLGFTDAYLKMPQAAFTDDNLFYVASQDFSFKGTDTDYVDQSLTLERVVARTELTCVDVPDDAGLQGRLENFFFAKLEGTGEESDAEWTVGKQVMSNIAPLLKENLYGDYENYTITVLGDDETETDVPCGEKLRELLKGETVSEAAVAALKENIISQLYRGLVVDPLTLDYQNAFLLQYNWKVAHAVKVTFESRTDKVGLDGKFSMSGTETAPVSMDVPVQEDGTVNLTTFCTAEAVSEEGETPDKVEQVIMSLAFYPEQVAGTEPMPVFTIACQMDYPLKLDLAANNRICLTLDPAVQILPKEGWYPATTGENPDVTKYVEVSAIVSLEDILKLENVFGGMKPPASDGSVTEGGDVTDSYTGFVNKINEVIRAAGLGSLTEFNVTVKIPNTFNSDTYTCVPGWKQAVNTSSNNE